MANHDDRQLLKVRDWPELYHNAYKSYDLLRRHSYLANIPGVVKYSATFQSMHENEEPITPSMKRPTIPAESLLMWPDLESVSFDTEEPSLAALASYATFTKDHSSQFTVLAMDSPRGRQVVKFCRTKGIEAYLLDMPKSMLLSREGHLNRMGTWLLARFVATRLERNEPFQSQ